MLHCPAYPSVKQPTTRDTRVGGARRNGEHGGRIQLGCPHLQRGLVAEPSEPVIGEDLLEDGVVVAAVDLDPLSPGHGRDNRAYRSFRTALAAMAAKCARDQIGRFAFTLRSRFVTAVQRFPGRR